MVKYNKAGERLISLAGIRSSIHTTAQKAARSEGVTLIKLIERALTAYPPYKAALREQWNEHTKEDSN